MRSRTAWLWALFVLLSVAPRTAGATVILPLALDDLIDGSERIAVVRVEAQAARWSADHRAIYTEVTLRVLEPLKGGGAAGETVLVRREGGVVGEVGMRVSGAAGFVTGEEAVVFLERRGGGALWTVGMAQGRMPLFTVAGRRVAARQTAGLAFVRPEAPEPALRPLDEIVARIAARLPVRGPAGVR